MTEKLHSIPDEAKMVLIGGGTLKTASSLLELGLDISGKFKPKVLVVPTAKNNKISFDKLIHNSKELFRNELGAEYDYLHEYMSPPSDNELLEKIDNADVLYISGGNTRHAINFWGKYAIDTAISDALRSKVMTGISAGLNVWFKDSFSDSQKHEVSNGEPWDFEIVEGMGHINATVNPHHNSINTPDGRPRSEYFKDYLNRNNFEQYCLGVDDNAALVALNGLVRVVINKTHSGVHVINRRNDTELEAPKFFTDKRNMGQINSDGISWQELYDQLSTK